MIALLKTAIVLRARKNSWREQKTMRSAFALHVGLQHGNLGQSPRKTLPLVAA